MSSILIRNFCLWEPSVETNSLSIRTFCLYEPSTETNLLLKRTLAYSVRLKSIGLSPLPSTIVEQPIGDRALPFG